MSQKKKNQKVDDIEVTEIEVTEVQTNKNEFQKMKISQKQILPVKKKRGKKPTFKNPTIVDPSIYNNKTIHDAKKENKQNRNEKRIGKDVQYNIKKRKEDISEVTKKETTIYDVFKAIATLKDNKEYNLIVLILNTELPLHNYLILVPL